MWIRKRSQQKRIDNTKDSCRCANANRKRKDANGGQSSVRSELTESIAQVLPRRLPAGRCYRFRCDFKTASLQPDLPCGILSAHTVSHFLESEFPDHGFSQYPGTSFRHGRRLGRCVATTLLGDLKTPMRAKPPSETTSERRSNRWGQIWGQSLTDLRRLT